MKKWLIILLIVLIVLSTLIILAFFSFDTTFSDYGVNEGLGLRYSPPRFWHFLIH